MTLKYLYLMLKSHPIYYVSFLWIMKPIQCRIENSLKSKNSPFDTTVHTTYWSLWNFLWYESCCWHWLWLLSRPLPARNDLFMSQKPPKLQRNINRQPAKWNRLAMTAKVNDLLNWWAQTLWPHSIALNGTIHPNTCMNSFFPWNAEVEIEAIVNADPYDDSSLSSH